LVEDGVELVRRDDGFHGIGEERVMCFSGRQFVIPEHSEQGAIEGRYPHFLVI
jgi:hypothetical protein